MFSMAKTANRPKEQPERRRSNRTPLCLSAGLREGNRSKVATRIIDISVNGCRVECSSTFASDTWLWLNIHGLESQYCRVVWQCQEFVGLEFEKPLPEALIDRLLQDAKPLPARTIKELRDIAMRTLWLAREANETDMRILAEISRKCAADAISEGLRPN